MKVKKVNGINCGFIDDAEFKKDVEVLAKKIHKKFEEILNYQINTYHDLPKYFYGIPRGGLIPAVYLSHRLGIPMLSYSQNYYSRLIEGYIPGNTDDGCWKYDDEEKILVIDDLFDTGKTYERYRDKCWEYACVYVKGHKNYTQVSGKPFADVIYAKDVPDIPIIFPWENAKSVINHMKESGRL